MLFLDATNEPTAVREAVYELTLSGISPVTVQTGGVQGEHRATRLKFQLSSELSGWEGAMLDKGRLFVRADACDGSGVVHRGVPLELTGNVQVLYYDLEQAATRCGGFVKVQLVFSVLDDDNCTLEQVKSYYATLELESAPNHKDDDWRDMNGLFQQAGVYAETAENAAAAAQEAAEEAQAAAEAATDAEQGAQSAQTSAESYAQSAIMASNHANAASQTAISAAAQAEEANTSAQSIKNAVEQTADEAAASALKALQAEDNAADWANTAKETVEALPVENGEGPNSVVQKRAGETFKNKATGQNSAAFGEDNTVTGACAAAFGGACSAESNMAFACGYEAKAIGPAAAAFGTGTQASGSSAFAAGNQTAASGAAAHAEGVQAKAQGEAAHAEGLGTGAAGDYTHAEGMSSLYFELLKDAEKQDEITGEQIETLAERIVHIFNYGNFTNDAGELVTFSVEDLWRVWKRQDTDAISNPLLYAFDQLFPDGDPARLLLALGNWVHAEGCNNLNAAEAAHIEGILNIIGKGYYGAHAEGGYNLLANAYGHAEGFENKLTDGRASHIEGQQNEGAGDYNHIEGYKNRQINGDKSDIGGELNTSSGSRNVVRGKQNNVTGGDNVVVGTTNTVEADGGIVFGETNEIRHDGVRALGNHLTSYAAGQTLLGQWNADVSGAELVYGCGSGDGANRKNLFYGRDGRLHAGSPLLGESDTRYMTVGYGAAMYFMKPETLRMAYAPHAVAVTEENDLFKRMIDATGAEVKGENNETRLLRLAVGDARYVQLEALKPRQTGAYYAFYDAGEALLGAVETYAGLVSGGTLYLAVPAGAAYLKLNHDYTADFAVTVYGDPAYVGELREAAKAAQAEAESKADALELGTSAGKAVCVTDSADGRIIGLSVYGESSQDGTPSPEAPVEIVSAENPAVEVYGKNLIPFPYSTSTTTINGVTFTVKDDGSVVVDGTATGDAQFRLYTGAKIKGNNTFTLSGCPAGGSAETYYLRARIGGETMQDIGNASTYTVGQNNPSEEYAYIIIKSGTTVNDLLFKPQMEIGSTATAYEPYKQPQSVTIPYTLRGIKGSDGGWVARDEIVVDGKKQSVTYIKHVNIREIANTQTWTEWQSGNGSRIILYTTAKKTSGDTLGLFTIGRVNQNLLSERPEQRENSNTIYALSGNTTNYWYPDWVAMGLTGTEDTATANQKLQEWLANITIKEFTYVLAQPIVTDITETETGQALLALYTYAPNTTVICDTDCQITYKADTTAAYNQLVQRIAALEAAIVSNI